MGRIFLIESRLVKAEKFAVALLVGLMIALSFLQLLLRLVFSQSILWLDPLLRHMVLWAGFTGAALASREGQHFALDIMHKMLPGKSRRAVELSGAVFAALACAALLAASCVFIRDEFSAGTTAFAAGSVNVPAWAAELAIPLGFGLMLLHSVAGIFRERPQ
ncbi:MAG: TRAP transporter small permease [Elusimicrobiales bacterium]